MDPEWLWQGLDTWWWWLTQRYIPCQSNRSYRSICSCWSKPLLERMGFVRKSFESEHGKLSKLIWNLSLKYLTPFPEHSALLWFAGHFDVSMYGKRLTHVWLTQTRFSPQGVPSRTRPCSGNSVGSSVPLVALWILRLSLLHYTFLGILWVVSLALVFSAATRNNRPRE